MNTRKEKHMSIKKIATVIVAAVVVSLAGPSALAQEEQPARDGEVVKGRCIAAIEHRLHRIDRLQDAVADSEHLSADHEAVLNDQLAAAETSLTDLKATIQGEDDPEELREECRSIVEDYRIYLLVVPRTLLTLGADAAVAAAGRLTDIAAKIQTKIDEAAADGKDVTQAQAEHDSMVANAQEADSAAAGVPDAVLPLEPSGYPDNKPILDEAKVDMRSARDNLHEARRDGYEAVEALRNA